jgi:GAF domain-containing protein/HAMP domain-containing protein
MIERFLRRLTVRSRILGGFLLLVVLLNLPLPLLVTNFFHTLEDLQQRNEAEASVERLLWLASAQVASSRVNLFRYLQDYQPSPSEVLDNIDAASQYLTEAQDILTSPAQKAAVSLVLADLVEDRALINDIKTAREQDQPYTRPLFDAYQLGQDIGQQLENIAQENEERTEAASENAFAATQRRQIALLALYGLMLLSGLALAVVVARSITHPVAELSDGAEAFRLGQTDVVVPSAGSDELSLLARTFNQFIGELAQSQQELEQRVSWRTRDLERRATYLEALAEVTRAVSSLMDTGQLLQQAVDLIRMHFDLYYVGLFLVDETGQWAVLRAGTGQTGRAMRERGHRIRMGEGMIGWSIAYSRARVAAQASADAVRLQTPELPETRSEAALPLRSRGRAIGALSVQSDKANVFDQVAIPALQAIASHIALALDSARLHAESQTAQEATRRAFGEISQQAWTDLLKTRTDWGYRYARHRVEPAQGAWRVEMRRAAEARQTVLSPVRPRLASEPESQPGAVLEDDGAAQPALAIPVMVRDQVVGVLGFRKEENSPDWTSEEINLLETLAAQLGPALEGAQLYRETQNRAARERLTGQIAARMRETLDMEVVLQTAAQQMREVLGLAEAEVRLGTAPESD